MGLAGWVAAAACGEETRKKRRKAWELAPNKNLFPTFYREAGRICG